MAQEAWMTKLSDLDDDQLFAVAVGVLAAARFVVSKRRNNDALPVHVHVFAAAGCGKTTVLNVIA
jgi:ABC-type taurine transport system ATPase subunit